MEVQPSRVAFEELEKLAWVECFRDSGSEDWREKWSLDGQKATVQNSPEGMIFRAGPVERDNASHAVLWTKESFSSDVLMTFEYARLDSVQRYVNILYIQATGTGLPPYAEDISSWSGLRCVSSMDTYYENMNLLHISFAAFGPKGGHEYIRARRYPVSARGNFQQFDIETRIEPDCDSRGFFETGILHRFTVIKRGFDLFMKIEPENLPALLCYWRTDKFPMVDRGCIGIRHMCTRAARYSDFRVCRLRA